MFRWALLQLAALSVLAVQARDDASIAHCHEAKSCPDIPSSISLSDDCKGCEYFHISTNCPAEYYHLDVYDRSGARVYSTYDINKDWDGSFDHSYLPVGCYTYEVLYRISLAEPLQIHRGTVVFLH